MSAQNREKLTPTPNL